MPLIMRTDGNTLVFRSAGAATDLRREVDQLKEDMAQLGPIADFEQDGRVYISAIAYRLTEDFLERFLPIVLDGKE